MHHRIHGNNVFISKQKNTLASDSSLTQDSLQGEKGYGYERNTTTTTTFSPKGKMGIRYNDNGHHESPGGEDLGLHMPFIFFSFVLNNSARYGKGFGHGEPRQRLWCCVWYYDRDWQRSACTQLMDGWGHCKRTGLSRLKSSLGKLQPCRLWPCALANCLMLGPTAGKEVARYCA